MAASNANAIQPSPGIGNTGQTPSPAAAAAVAAVAGTSSRSSRKQQRGQQRGGEKTGQGVLGWLKQSFRGGATCEMEGNDEPAPREVTVLVQCCPHFRDMARGIHLSTALETETCQYEMKVCFPSLCKLQDRIRSEFPAESSKGGDGAEGNGKEEDEEEEEDEDDDDDDDEEQRSRSERMRKKDLDTGLAPMTEAQREANLEAARQMFTSGYDNYMEHAYPEGELRPMTCGGQPFDLSKLPVVTLVDTLDTLVIMNNHSEFRRAVEFVVAALPEGFNFDVNVSVFETTIRLLGGLLSAHILATDPDLAVYPSTSPPRRPEIPAEGSGGSEASEPTEPTEEGSQRNFMKARGEDGILRLMPSEERAAHYDGVLLDLAEDLGERLLPAFETNTKIPYGTVNLRHGVPPEETTISSLAGAGSLTLEFAMLSDLTHRPEFKTAACEAAVALYERRTNLGLLGKHVNIQTGKWTETVTGIGSNADSFFEYLAKMYLLFGEEEWWWRFLDTYDAINKHLRRGDWFGDVDIYSGNFRRQRFENLMAFWPGLQV